MHEKCIVFASIEISHSVVTGRLVQKVEVSRPADQLIVNGVVAVVAQDGTDCRDVCLVARGGIVGLPLAQ